MVSQVDEAKKEIEPLLEEAKQPTRGRPRKETTDDEAYRKVSLKVMRSMDRSLRGVKAMLGEGGGGRPREVRIGRYFLAMQGMPGATGLEDEVNRLLAEWASQGWYPVGHVTSQSGVFDTGVGGQLQGDVITILWGHD